MAEERPFDIVLLGATGFTGGLATEVLAARAREEGVRYALAGRSPDRLKAVVGRLESAGHAAPPVIEVSTDSPRALADMASRSRAVISTVGPYVRHGLPVARACVEQRADYVDITGEPPFVDALIRELDAPAREAGVRLVSCCGFDSIPPDLGVFYTLQRLGVDGPVEVEGVVETRAQMSGGTWHSALGIFADPRRPTPALSEEPQAGPGRRVAPGALRLQYRRELDAWVAPMPTIDPQIVLRSARLMPEYGSDFRYAHGVRVGSLAVLLAAGVGLGAVGAAARWAPTRRWLEGLRRPGDGPSEAQRARGHFSLRFEARSAGRRLVTEVRGGDPGYTETSKMVVAAALCLARDRDRLPARAGVLTPAAAFGQVLVDRLVAAGISFETLELDEG